MLHPWVAWNVASGLIFLLSMMALLPSQAILHWLPLIQLRPPSASAPTKAPKLRRFLGSVWSPRSLHGELLCYERDVLRCARPGQTNADQRDGELGYSAK